MMKSKLILIALVAVFVSTSCKKDTKTETPVDPTPTPAPTTTLAPSVAFNFKAMANSLTLTPVTKHYAGVFNDFYTVTKFTYYISNVKLKRADGFVFAEPESYHLIKHVEGATSFTLNDVPEGTYNHIEFLIGVDSLRNVSGAQSGALDVANDMFWDWNTGYIFFKLEGSYVSATVNTSPEAEYSMHIGGFKGKFSCLQKCSYDLASPIVAQKGKQSNVFNNVIIDEIFKTPVTFGFDQYYSSITESTFKLISDNYKDMIVVDHVEN